MHYETLSRWRHDHDFVAVHEHGERRTLQVLVLTAVTMVAEIVAGTLFGSMALLADGWHMGTHVAAFLISIFAYRYARAHARDPAYSFGTGKVSVLGGFASAVTLGVVALMMVAESAHRLLSPETIHFNQAIAVAVFGLAVNVVSALLLQGHDHHHHDHHHDHHAHDHTLHASYVHVLADALTSVFAIVALLGAKYFGWGWIDPMMGIVGALVITRWALGLVRDTGPVLLDGGIDEGLRRSVLEAIENDADNRVADLHLWRVGPDHYAVIVSLVTHQPRPPEHYKGLLAGVHHLAHVTVEVNHCHE